ncbi:transposase [Pseudoxanthomonas sp. UTMC 1351]|uniref:transposase n=1 Tax=Pseudoxanthomonas sp. UTMC 1351 TaxID=2695853 RepID=UPI0034CDD369
MELIHQQTVHSASESRSHVKPYLDEPIPTLPVIQFLDDVAWETIANRLRGKTRARALKGTETRRFIEIVLWVTGNELSWSRIPARYGKWHSIYVRFGRWADAYTWDQLAAVMDSQRSAAQLQRRVETYRASCRARKIPKGIAAVEDRCS